MPKIVFRNKEYESIADIYRNNKHLNTVSLSSVQKKIRKGMNVEEALTTPGKGKLGTHIVEGIQFPDLISIAKEYGMSPATVYKRYSRGYRDDDLVPERENLT